MPEIIKMSIKSISITGAGVIFVASVLIYIGQLRGQIAQQAISIDSLQKEKLDISVYEANHKNLYDIINLNNIKNDSEHQTILKTLEKIDNKIDKITLTGK